QVPAGISARSTGGFSVAYLKATRPNPPSTSRSSATSEFLLMRSPQPEGKEQRLLQNARREALLLMKVWAVSLIWTVASGYWLGYRAEAADAPLIAGFPRWVFWSVVVPWGVCLLFSGWF